MSGANRKRRPGRRSPFRDPRPIVFILCEGQKTERQYFKQFAHHHRNSLIEVKISNETGVPFSLVENAIEQKELNEEQAQRQKDQNILYDSVWCVFDVDNHPRVAEARKLAAANNIHVAISNPCFELWLILHFRESPGMQESRQLQNLLKTYDRSYENDPKSVDFTKYALGYDQAVKRAKRLGAMAREVGDERRNPTTNVHELTERIIRGGNEAEE